MILIRYCLKKSHLCLMTGLFCSLRGSFRKSRLAFCSRLYMQMTPVQGAISVVLQASPPSALSGATPMVYFLAWAERPVGLLLTLFNPHIHGTYIFSTYKLYWGLYIHTKRHIPFLFMKPKRVNGLFQFINSWHFLISVSCEYEAAIITG